MRQSVVKKEDQSKWDLVWPFILMIWDGIGFFGTESHKLNRLRGEKVTCWTRLTSMRMRVMITIYIIAFVLVCVFELTKIGSVASTKVDLTFNNLKEYQLTEGLPLIFFLFFTLDTTIPRANEVLKTNRDKHPLGKEVLPNTKNYAEFDWADKKYFEWFLCEHAKVVYKETMFFNPANYPAEWYYRKQNEFKCIPMPWANDKIRVAYVVDHKEHEPSFNITNPEVDQEVRKEKNSLLETATYKKYVTEAKEKKMLFLRSQVFRNFIEIELNSTVMKGVRMKMRSFYNRDLKDKPDKYNGWNMSTVY